MPIITLTTDFGTRDYSVAAVKGMLLKKIDKPVIIDISHAISPYNLAEAAYILKAAYPNFPKKTIHIIGVNAEKTPLHKHLIVVLNEQYFIGADTGIFSLLAGEDQIEKIIAIDNTKAKECIFPTKDIFTDIAAKIADNQPLDSLGTVITSVKKWRKINPNISKKEELIGHIVYVDEFGNLSTDISKEFFETFRKNRRFEIIAAGAKITEIYSTYDGISNYNLPASQRKKAGKSIAVFNALNYLEIALYKSDPSSGGSAFSLLGLRIGDSVKIIFE